MAEKRSYPFHAMISFISFFSECPGGVANVCSGHGVCNDSVGGTGLCTCEVSSVSAAINLPRSI